MPCKFIAMNCFVSLCQDLVYIFLTLKKSDIEFPNLFLIIQNMSNHSLNWTKISVVQFQMIFSLVGQNR